MINYRRVVFIWLLLLFPLVGLSTLLPWKFGKLPTLMYLTAGIVVVLASKSGVFTKPHWQSSLPLALLALSMVATSRGNDSIRNVMVIHFSQLLLYLFAVFLAVSGPRARTVVAGLLASCVALSFLNVTLWWLGVENASTANEYLVDFESMFEFLGVRAHLPLSGGVSQSAMVSAVGGLSSLALLT